MLYRRVHGFDLASDILWVINAKYFDLHNKEPNFQISRVIESSTVVAQKDKKNVKLELLITSPFLYF